MKHNKLYILSATAAGMIFLSSCSKQDRLTNPVTPDPTTSAKVEDDGYVYTESNTVDGNMIISYEQHSDGTLTEDTTVETGGTGTGAGLGSQGAVILNDDHTRLFAVNAGSNTISSFELDDDGIPALKDVVSSGGMTPISLTIYGNWLYVVNSGSSDIMGFMVESDGSLTPLPGSNRSLSSSSAGPAQISFKPNGNQLVVAEKATNMITVFDVNSSGIAQKGQSFRSKGKTPFGFEFNTSKNFVVSNAAEGAPGKSSLTSYFMEGGSKEVDGPVQNGQTAACWVVIAKKSYEYVYVTNTGSNTISSYTLDDNGNLALAHAVAATTGVEPLDAVLSGGQQSYLYNINGISQTISEFSRNADGTLTNIGEVGGLPPHAAGLAAFK